MCVICFKYVLSVFVPFAFLYASVVGLSEIGNYMRSPYAHGMVARWARSGLVCILTAGVWQVCIMVYGIILRASAAESATVNLTDYISLGMGPSVLVAAGLIWLAPAFRDLLKQRLLADQP